MTDYVYGYESPSVLQRSAVGAEFLLSHCSEIEEDQKTPCFFYGQLTESFVVSKCLSALAKTVRSHFSLTPGQIAALRDPIVSVGSQKLLFEAFSSCNSVYARVEVLPEGIDGEFVSFGCTNVDFNDETVRAFNTITGQDSLILGIGKKEVQVFTPKISTIEKKVTLPNRWIKGLGNVQVYLANMEFAFSLNQVQAIQLFQTLPKQPVKTDYFLVNRAGKIQFSPSAQGKAVRVGGAHRLRLLENLLPFISTLSCYQELEGQCMTIVLHFKHLRMLFSFSANVFRGFSGEGKLLENLNTSLPEEWILGLHHVFKTNETINTTLLAIEKDVDFTSMNQLEASLSALGLLGYNVEEREHFYRRLPFKLERLYSLNPRLRNAHKLLEMDSVVIVQHTHGRVEANVKGSSDVSHKVIIDESGARCTCPWYTQHQTKRGVCKHILAVRIMMEKQ